MVFKLLEQGYKDLLSNVIAPRHLTYVEWFSLFTNHDCVHSMYKVFPSWTGNQAFQADVIEVKSIHQSCHLIPVCSSIIPQDWTSSSMLDSAKEFYINPFSDPHIYMTLV